MYHPTRGGVRGGRDQFKWDDVKVDKHRENYLGHSIKAPVGRWQKGKDLHWYARDKKSNDADLEAAREEIKRIKEEEEQAMREALGLAPKRSDRPRGNRLDKHEYSELIKRGSTTEDLSGGHAEAANVHGLGFARTSRPWTAESSSLTAENLKEAHLPEEASGATRPQLTSGGSPEADDDSGDGRRKRRREERKQEKREKRQREYDDNKKHKRDKGKRRHGSD